MRKCHGLPIAAAYAIYAVLLCVYPFLPDKNKDLKKTLGLEWKNSAQIISK
jgi:hypothetical protein